MPISSTATQTALLAERTQLVTQIKDLEEASKNRSTALSSALKDLRNRCVELDSRTFQAVKEGGLLKQEVALRADLAQTHALQGDQPLRLKEQARVVPMRSNSFIKRLLGIGQARRDRQAAALADRHGFAAGPVTRERLKEALSGIQDKKDALRDRVLQSHARELHATFVNAAQLATFDSIAVEDLKDYATRAIGRLQGHAMFADGFAGERSDLRDTQARARDELLAPLKARRHELDAQVRTLTRQDVRGERARLLAADGVTAGEGARALQERLQALKDQCQFSAIYHTNAGCKAINGMMEGRQTSVTASAIIDEIRRVHGQDCFARGAEEDKAALKAGAAQLTPKMAARINDTCHALALAEFREGTRDYVTTYRQAQHSPEMLYDLVHMAGSTQLLRPTRFLSTADNKEDTLRFPAFQQAGMKCVQFTIDGFSAMKTGSRWRVDKEGQERLYSTHSCFRVTSVRKDDSGIWQVKLREQLVNADQQPHRFLTL